MCLVDLLAGQIGESGHADTAHVPHVERVKGQAGMNQSQLLLHRPLLLLAQFTQKQGDIFPAQLIWAQHMPALQLRPEREINL